MKLDLSQYREMLSFAQIASDLEETTQELLRKGVRMTEVLKQKLHQPLSFEEEFISLYAVVKGYLSSMEPSDIPDFETKMLEQIRLNQPYLLEEINKASKLSTSLEKELDETLKELVSDYMDKKVKK